MRPDGHREGRDIVHYHVYILQSKRNGRYYIGSTNNLERRMMEHGTGKTKSLRYLRPLICVLAQKYSTALEARKIEKKLKQFKSKAILDKIVSEKKITLGL